MLIMNTLQWDDTYNTGINPAKYIFKTGWWKSLLRNIELSYPVLWLFSIITWKHKCVDSHKLENSFRLLLMLSVQASFTTSGWYHFNSLTWFSYLQSCSRLIYPPHCHQCNLVFSCFESSGARQGLVLTLARYLISPCLFLQL